MAQSRKPKAKLARARTILTNFQTKNGVLPERQAAMKLLRKRLDVTSAQSSTYFNMIRKELAKAADAVSVDTETEAADVNAA